MTITNEITAVVGEESGGDESTNEVVMVIVHLDHHHHRIGSKLLTNFYRTSKFKKLNSNIVIQDNIAICNELIYHTKHSKSIPPQLLYRGTRDGFKGINFHSRCDNQGPTLTIIKSSEPTNQIFGGFTTASWNPPSSSPSFAYISDDSAFLFKIDDYNNQLFRKFNIKQVKKQNAIFVYKNCMPIFGGGHDIFISSDCNLNSDSRSNFGNTYELPTTTNNDEFKYGSEKAKNYLAGSFHFKVSEIEVFKITTIQ